MTDNCPKCGKKMNKVERVENLSDVVLNKQPRLMAVFKWCRNCGVFFARWFRKDRER